jgi:hypothetical protein
VVRLSDRIGGFLVAGVALLADCSPMPGLDPLLPMVKGSFRACKFGKNFKEARGVAPRGYSFHSFSFFAAVPYGPS